MTTPYRNKPPAIHQSTDGLVTACGWSVKSGQYPEGTLMTTDDATQATCRPCRNAVVDQVAKALHDANLPFCPRCNGTGKFSAASVAPGLEGTCQFCFGVGRVNEALA